MLEQSLPRRNQALLAPTFLAAILLAAVISLPGDNPWLAPLVPLAFGIVLFFAVRHASRLARQQREELETMRLADEGIRLGRWEQVSATLIRILSGPAQRPHVRFQALIYLGGLLNRVGRFADVIRLYDYLQEQAEFPPPISLSLRCMRAYAMLRDDRLSDAYQAISELRREYPQTSGVIGLLEIYRLVKTGHHEDTLQLFEQRRGLFAEQLSHRSADGWALAAVSALALSRFDQARMYARHACLLADHREIAHRFPECAAVLKLACADGGAAA